MCSAMEENGFQLLENGFLLPRIRSVFKKWFPLISVKVSANSLKNLFPLDGKKGYRFYYPNWSICWKILFHYTKQLLFLAKQSKTVSLYGETASSGKKIENGFTIRRNCFFWQKKVENGFTIWRNCFFWQKNQKWFLLWGNTASCGRKIENGFH